MSTDPSDGQTLVHAPRRGYARLLVTVPVAGMLLAAIAFSASAFVHSQLLSLGQSVWDAYGIARHVTEAPDCDPDPDVDARVRQRLEEAKKSRGDSLLEAEPPDREAIRESILARREQCRKSHRAYRYSRELRASSAFRAFTAVEGAVGAMAKTSAPTRQYLLVLVIVLCAWMATAVHGHVALRAPLTRRDCRVSAAVQLAGSLLLLASARQWQEVAADSGAAQWLHWVWVAGFGGLALISLERVLRPPAEAPSGGGTGRALLSVPLYAYMALIAGGYFLLREGYASGLAVQLIQLVDQADLYINVALYVWVGMLIRQTRLAGLLFDVVRPWRLSPELMSIVVVLAAALPTAVTGASGILLVAVGAVIYDEIRLSGARRPLAFASTAMSGSMGVVLSPCLMVVIVAALNQQVTTAQLYGWGVNVFLLTATLFALVVEITRREALRAAPIREALPASLRALRPLLPYALIAAAVGAFSTFALDQPVNEFSAPTLLPGALLLMLLYDRRAARRRARAAGETVPEGFWLRVREGTAEATVHIGALLTLLMLSVALGGVIERSAVMTVFPEQFASIWVAMASLVVILVVIGMIIEPYGAIILVSATIASVAYDSGIHPVHFWMVVLVAFELGYLTPPVAINQLLTRQVVGDAELRRAWAEQGEAATFWRRHEQILMPLAVLAAALVLVAFGPLLVYA